MSEADSAAHYKKLKEDFVTGLSGGDVSEICFVTGVAPVALFVWSILQSRLSFFKPYTPLATLLDFLLNVCAFLLATTLYSNSPLVLSTLILAPSILVYAFPTHTPRKKPRVPPLPKPSPSDADHRRSPRLDPLPQKPFLTAYRGGMLIATTVAILAVDFPIFPRRFAKVETWGTSLMDMGVGAFVFSAGVVAARPVLRDRLLPSASSSPTSPTTTTTTTLPKRLADATRHSLPLFALGLIRLASVKSLDYAEHVSEYGVHWNFFFTLALLPPFVALFRSALAVVPSFAALALGLGAAYQIALERTGLKAYILAAPREGWLGMNREGVFSFVGYLAIFLAGQDVGMLVLPREGGGGVAAARRRRELLGWLAAVAAGWSFLYFAATSYRFGLGLGVSRRMANLPYILWVVAFNTAQIFAFCLVDTIFFPPTYSAVDKRAEKEAYRAATSRVLHAYNRNGLALFLLANLLTGAVNMSVKTLFMSPPEAMGILLLYVGVVTAVALGLDAYEISIKL